MFLSLPQLRNCIPLLQYLVPILIIFMLFGCVKSKTPLITKETADYPLGKYTHLVKYKFDKISNRWRSINDAAIRRSDDQYVFEERDNGVTRFMAKKIKNIKNGELFLVQDDSEQPNYQLVALTTEGFMFFGKKYVYIYEFDTVCKESGFSQEKDACVVPDMKAMRKIIDLMDFDENSSETAEVRFQIQ